MKTNKPYFAKYLPVEGEIKPDDTIIYDGKIMKQGAVSYVIYGEDLKNILLNTQNEIDSRKKVKLFLCSRDIQVSHELTCLDGTKSTVELDGQLFYMDRKLWFRIVGEISPEATWVKEGDEFDSTDVKRIANGIANPIGSKYHVYEILGPCRHFH